MSQADKDGSAPLCADDDPELDLRDDLLVLSLQAQI